MIINTWRDPYDSGFSPTRPKQIEIKPGLTVLVGCNGAGKTTLLNNIELEMKKNKIPCHKYNNLHDGGVGDIFGQALGGYGEDKNDLGLAVSMWASSEGECIKLNIGRQSRLYKEFFESGYYKDRNYRWKKIFNDEIEEIKTKQRILLFDAVDSGLSVDSVVEIVNLFNDMLNDAKELGIELYLIISANEYELARGNSCFDVNTGKYISFKDYEGYRSFIIKSRKKKEKRIEQQQIFFQKRYEKEKAEAIKFIEEANLKISKLKSKTELFYSDERRIRDLQDEIEKRKKEFNLE